MFFRIVTLISFFLTCLAYADDSKIIGKYYSDKKDAKIEIFKRDDKIFGKFIWLKNNDIDTLNPDPLLRNKPLIGAEILKNFKYSKDNEWTSGTIYDPESGKTYNCYMWFETGNFNKLKIKGYIGISLFGRTVEFEKISD